MGVLGTHRFGIGRLRVENELAAPLKLDPKVGGHRIEFDLLSSEGTELSKREKEGRHIKRRDGHPIEGVLVDDRPTS